MKRRAGWKLQKIGGKILVQQGSMGKYDITYNPDDERFYITADEDTVATFANWKNAVYYVRTHNKGAQS